MLKFEGKNTREKKCHKNRVACRCRPANFWHFYFCRTLQQQRSKKKIFSDRLKISYCAVHGWVSKATQAIDTRQCCTWSPQTTAIELCLTCLSQSLNTVAVCSHSIPNDGNFINNIDIVVHDWAIRSSIVWPSRTEIWWRMKIRQQIIRRDTAPVSITHTQNINKPNAGFGIGLSANCE